MTPISPKRLEEIEAYQAEQKRLNGSPTPTETTLQLTPEQTTAKTDLFDYAQFRRYIPSEMLTEKRWVRYFLKPKPEGGTAKIPLGNHSDPATWSTFHNAVDAIENNQQGIGYCFLGGEILALDIDHCRNPKTGRICNEAMVLLSRLQSWAEYSVSGQGIHLLFKGNVRGKQLNETCLQFWNSKNSPRFFAMTCNMVGEAFTQLKDIGDEFNYIFATARHISAKIREELKEIDPEQWAALPVEREPVAEQTKEKSKHKTRKLHPDFNVEDFLNFYSLPVDNVTKNELGTCYRLTTCPIKGEKHVGQNSTTTNFILSSDGGLGFHCQSTGCVDWQVSQVIAKLAEEKGPYPKPIYVADKKQPEIGLVYKLSSLDQVEETSLSWLWPGFLPDNQLVHFAGASSEGKSPVTLDIIARVTTGKEWPDGTPNTLGPRSVILMAGEDDLSDTVKPRLRLAGADISKVKIFQVTAKRDDKETDLSAALDRDYQGLVDATRSLDDLALIVIDPITNYLGKQSMNKEEDIRGNISMPLKGLAQDRRVCIVTVGHLNKRDKEATVLQRTMGAAAFTGVPRKVFIFGNDPKDDSKHAHIMTEVRDKQVSIQYKTVALADPQGIQKSPIIKVEWGKLVEVDADEVVNAPKQREKSANKEVRTFLKAFLRSGAKPTKLIVESLKEAGIDTDKFNWQRAAKSVAESRPITGHGKNAGYEWFLPTPEQAEFDGSRTRSGEARV